MCPVWERDDRVKDPAVRVSLRSYDGAIDYIFNVKKEFPHLKLLFEPSLDGMWVWNFGSDTEMTYFMIKMDSFKGLYG